ncbi:MAG: spore cortex biosynthesis protein YabQ [Limnochordia bacterium]
MPSLSTQISAFLTVIAAGVFLGGLFDVYRVFRGFARPGAVLTTLFDAFFWLVASPCTIWILLTGNWGELRFYVPVGFLLGLFLYFVVISPFMVQGLITLAVLSGSGAYLILRVLFALVSLPVYLVAGAVVFLQDGPLGRRSWRRRSPLSGWWRNRGPFPRM